MKGEALKSLQSKIGVTADGAFGYNTARAIVDFYGYTPEQGAHFLGQCYHESAGFTVSIENLNYSAEAIRRTWRTRFETIADAEPYERNPEKLANNVYADRMGNGPEASGDGWKYRGRGFVQLTGKNNVTAFAHAISRLDLIEIPEPIEVELAFDAAVWYFGENDLFKLARNGVDDETIRTITKRVNGGHHGLDERTRWTKKIYGWLTS